jgi:ligand-binding sensor domain-containing protein
MKLIIMNSILCCCILVAFSSCSGQSMAQSANSAINKSDLITARGETVSSISKGALYVFQDRNNNYWFGSDGEGTYRYDGKNLIHFSTKEGLCNDRIRGIQEDKLGNVYFNTVNGISKFDGRTFTTLKSTKSDLPNGGWKLHSDDLWFAGAQDSAVVYRYDGITLHRLEFPKTKAGEDHLARFPRSKNPQMNFSPYDVYSIYKDKSGNLWFGTNIGVCRYDGKTFGWMSEKELGIDAIAIHVRSTIEDKNGDFWFGNIMHRFHVYPDYGKSKGGAISFREEKGIVDSKVHDAAYFMSGIEDGKGDLWTVTYDKGVWRYDGKRLTQYQIKDGNKDVTLFCIYQDRQGDLWVGTHTAGAYKFNGKTFQKFKP